MDIKFQQQPNDIVSHFQRQGYQQTQYAPNVEHKQPQFNPYVNNYGTVVAVGGEGFCVIASCTRISDGYDIVSRNTSKQIKLGSTTVLGSSGMHQDFRALGKMLKARLTQYEFNMGREANTNSVAQLLSNTLYGKRFFPYYTFNLLAGLDSNNNGVVYGYDAIGSFEPLRWGAQGSGQQIIIPLLDQQLRGYNKINHKPPQTQQEVVDLILDSFHSCAERDIYTGDQVEVTLIEKDGIKTQFFPIRRD